jgi:hypothetical protein
VIVDTLRADYSNLRSAVESQVLEAHIPVGNGDAAAQWWARVQERHVDAGLPAQRQPKFRELIYCYWLEQGMLAQAMEAILLRFQNRAVGPYSALARFDLTPLRAISDLLWGFIDDQHRRLSLRRRAFEYVHQYGLRLFGRAVGHLRAADDRSRFLESFHTLLNVMVPFYREVDDLTVRQDARPVLNALKDLHQILSEGAHNQFATVPLQARVEMRVIQTLFDFPEFQQFLGAPLMIDYPETWIGRVDTVRRLMGWGDTSMVEFRNLAVHGEQLILSVRYGDFGPDQTNVDLADSWGEVFRNSVMQYIHSYRAVTGVDLSAPVMAGQAVDATQPSVYLVAREERARFRTGTRG